MKKVLFALAVVVMSASVWAEAKTWPASYNIATLTAAQVPTATGEGTFGPYATERAEKAEALSALDTFLFAIFDAQGSLTGLSTMAPGALLFLR